MMAEGNCSDGILEIRSALADVTNRVAKRGFSCMSGSSVVKSGDGCAGLVENKDENLGRENVLSKDYVSDKDGGKRACIAIRPCIEINSLKGNVISGISKIPFEAKEPNPVDGSSSLGTGDAAGQSTVELGDSSRDKCVSSISVPTSSCNSDGVDIEGNHHKDEGVSSEVGHSSSLHDHLVRSIYRNEGNDVGIDNVESGKCESIECSRFPESQESNTLGGDRCIGLKGDGGLSSSAGVDLIKACSCSFCTKAAYIWSDLHYQDTKGRIAALKKSQKEASILVHRYSRNNEINNHEQGNFSKSSKLESDLMGQWSSLFLHMENMFGHESSQLEASLLTLTDLRENCKTELELINGISSEKR